MFFAYNLAWFLFTLTISPYLLVKLFFRGRDCLLNRLGYLPGFQRDASRKYVWVHCASVGEIMTAAPFIRRLKDELDGRGIVLSVMTAGGFNTAISLNLPVESVFFVPFDSSLFVEKAMRAVKPEALILIEAEFWPNLVMVARRRGARVFLVNARFSRKSEKFARIFPGTSRRVLGAVELFFAREQKDEEWILKFGIPRDRVLRTGNMKYDAQACLAGRQETPANAVNASKTQFGLPETGAVFTAGSVREGEELPVIEAFATAREKFPGLKMIFAPRHLNRIAESERILSSKGISHARFSGIKKSGAQGADCIVIDVFGELKNAYAAASAVFVGGGLVPHGGQNILEPALLGKPVIFGPHMSSFEEPADVLKKSGGGLVVRDASELSGRIIELVSDPALASRLGEAAMNAVLSMAGATDKNVKALKDALGKYRPNILLIQPSRIGDVVFSLPFLSNMRKMYPGARISWLVDDRCALLLDGNPYLDDKIIFPLKKLSPAKPFFTFMEIRKLKRELSVRGFDLSIDLHGLAKSAFIAAISGARVKIASSSTYGMKEFSWIISKEIPAGDEGRHTVERHLEVLKYLMKNDAGALKIEKFEMTFPLPSDEADSKYAEALLKDLKLEGSKKIAAVLTGGGWKSRRWPAEKFSQACDLLTEKCGADVVFIGGAPGGSPESGIIGRVMAGMKQKSYDFSGKLTLKQLIAFLRKCALYFGNEAGPMHIACALELPVVAIIGPTNPGRTGPFGGNHLIVKKDVPCAPCKERNCKKMDCMNLVTVEEAFEAARKMLKVTG